MTLRNVIRAWTDPAYRSSLSEAERAQLPGNPAGMIELTGTDLNVVAGGGKSGGSGESSEPSEPSESSDSSESSSAAGPGV